MKRIIIPTNLTNQSLNLIKYGVQMMKGETCQIFLLHLIPLPDSIPELLMLPREEGRLEKLNTSFSKALDRIRKSYAVEISSLDVIHPYGDSSLKVQNFIQNNGIDLVLCPVREAQNTLNDTCSMFTNIVKDISCPVLFIPDNSTTSHFRKITYVLDTEDKYTLSLDVLLNLISGSDYYVTFLVIFKPGTNMEKLEYVLNKVYMNEQLKAINCSVHPIQVNDFTGGVYTFVEEFKADLLVTSRRKSLLGNIFSKKRISSDMAKHTRVPYLAIA